MSIKTIMVHLAYDTHYQRQLDVALLLAPQFEAHIDLVYVTAPASTPVQVVGRGASSGYIAEMTQIAREHAVKIEEDVATLCRNANVSWKWHVEERDIEKALAHHAHLADMAIIGQTLGEHLEDRVIHHLPDHLVVVAGCPILLVPATSTITAVGRRILVAWKNDREAIKAVRNAIPFMQKAEKVVVLAEGDGNAPVGDIVGFLHRHDIKAELVQKKKSGAIGEVILDTVQSQGSDLLVMGAYAHSRFREIVFGGASDYIIRHSTVPVLMAH